MYGYVEGNEGLCCECGSLELMDGVASAWFYNAERRQTNA